MAFFLADSPVLLAQIAQAVREQNSHQLQLAAHRLKGMLARYACREGADLAYALEQAGKSGKLTEAADLLPRLAPHVAQLTQGIEAYVREQATR